MMLIEVGSILKIIHQNIEWTNPGQNMLIGHLKTKPTNKSLFKVLGFGLQVGSL